MGVESSKVEYLLSGPGKKVQLAITFRGENLNFYGQMTRVQVMMASLRCIQIGLPGSLLPESGRENSSPTVALYSQRLHIIFHTLSIPSQRTNGHSLFTVRQRTSKIRVNLSPNKVISTHFFLNLLKFLWAFCKLINLAPNMTKMLKNHNAAK